MPDLTFQIESAEAVSYAASPLMHLNTRIACQDSHLEIQSILLQCQIQIEPARRRYVASEQDNLRDLFGAPSRWGQTLRSILWSNSQLIIPRFVGHTVAAVPLPCTFDFNIASTKYFHGLENGEIPICVLFSGTIFYTSADGSLQVAKIPWSHEVNYRLAVTVWKEMMDMYYPNSSWLCVQRDVFNQLYRYKMDHGILTWDRTLESLLAAADGTALRKTGT